MTKQFKVGDKVRVINPKPTAFHNGYKIDDEFTVNDTYIQGVIVSFGNRDDLRLHESEIEIVKEDASMTKYKTEKRKANVGERILITNAEFTFGDYNDGDVFTVSKLYAGFSSGVIAKELGEDAAFIQHCEYEVIIDELEARVTELEAKVAELTAKKPTHASTFAETLTKAFRNKPKATPNEQRKATIERAKAFVADLEKRAIGDDSNTDGNALFNHRTTRVSFHVNAEKRVVTALAHGKNYGQILGKAFAKCAPDDVFNADIGKAIAAGRLYGVDVIEFENTVKPTEVVVGMVTNGREDNGFYSPDKRFKLTKLMERYSDAFYYEGCDDFIFGSQIGNILDDTAAQYV